MRTYNDENIQLPHLDKYIWDCLPRHNESVRFGTIKKLFVCWACCAVLTEEEGKTRLEWCSYPWRHTARCYPHASEDWPGDKLIFVDVYVQRIHANVLEKILRKFRVLNI